MIRDSLEMVPVAVIMAVILFFGMRKGAPTFEPVHPVAEHVFATVSGFPTIPEMMVKAPTVADTTTIAPPSDGPKRTVTSAPVVFIERKTPITGVPFYTNADLPQRSSSLSPTTQSGPSEATSMAKNNNDSRISISHADAKALTNIPGIGPLKARLILETRPANGFHSWDEIDAIPGFGAGTISMMKLHAQL